MTGLLFCFLLAELACCIVVKLEESFSFYCSLLAGMVCVCSLLSLIVNRKLAGLLWRQMREHIKGLFLHKKKRIKDAEGGGWRLPYWVCCWRCRLLRLFSVCAGYGGDIMTETIRTAELTDTIFCYDPLTGKLLANGMYPLLNWRPCRFCTAGFIGCAVCLCRLFLYVAVLGLSAASAVCRDAGMGGGASGRTEGEAKPVSDFCQSVADHGEGDTASYAYALLHHGWRGTTGMATVLLMGAYILMKWRWKKNGCTAEPESYFRCVWGDIHAAPFVSAGSHVYAGQ